MFVGHFALAMAAKRATPRVRLGTLVMAAQWLDLLWPIFLLLGWEQVRPAPGITAFTPFDFVNYPWTHSLLMACIWGVLFGVVFFAIRRNARAASILGLLVVSHWVLDWLTHRPDLPLYPGGPKVGLGLWNSIGWTLMIELLLFAAGIVVYLRATRAKDRIGTFAFWGLMVFLLAVYVSGLLPGPVPDQKQIGWMGLLLWLLPPWASWADRHRVLVKAN